MDTGQAKKALTINDSCQLIWLEYVSAFTLIIMFVGCAPKSQDEIIESLGNKCAEYEHRNDFPGYSSKHLVPRMHVDNYQDTIEQVLKNSFAPQIELRMLCKPSFSNEWTTGIKNNGDGTYSAFFERPNISIWKARYRDFIQFGDPEMYITDSLEWVSDGYPFGPPKINEIKTEFIENKIDYTTAKLVYQAWDAALSETAYPNPDSSEMFLDGIGYDFWLKKCPINYGSTHSPKYGSRMVKFINVAMALNAFAKADPKELQKFRTKLVAISKGYIDSSHAWQE